MVHTYNSVSVVCPMFNERDCIVPTIDNITGFFNATSLEYELIIVDDGSTDGSSEIVDDLCAMHPSLRVIHLERNRGIGKALREGFNGAQKDIIFYTDADLPVHMSSFSEAFDLIKKGDTDIVIGYRTGKRESFVRTIYTSVYNIIIQSLFRLNVKDINSAMKVFRRDIIKDMELRSDGPFIDAELVAHIKERGGRIAQIETTFVPRAVGCSKFASSRKILGTVVRMTVELVKFYPQRKLL